MSLPNKLNLTYSVDVHKYFLLSYNCWVLELINYDTKMINFEEFKHVLEMIKYEVLNHVLEMIKYEEYNPV